MPQPCHYPSHKAKKSWWGIEANPNNAGEWACSYLQKNERVTEWWREFQSLLCSKDENFSDIQVKGWPTCKSWPSDCQLHNGNEMAHRPPTLSGCAGAKGLPSSKGVPGNSRLLSGADLQNGGIAHDPLELCCLFQNTPGVLYGAAQELHGCLIPMFGVPCHKSPITYSVCSSPTN